MSQSARFIFNKRPVLVYDYLVVGDLFLIALFDGITWTFVDHHHLEPLFELIEDRQLTLVGFGNADLGDHILQFLLTHRQPTVLQITALTTLLAKPWNDRTKDERNELNSLTYGTPIPWAFTVDLARVIAKPRLSLAAWQCRLGCERVTMDDGPQSGNVASRPAAETVLRDRITTMALLLERAQPLLAMRSTLI